MDRLSTDAPRASETDLPVCMATADDWFCTAVRDHEGPHVAYLTDGSVGIRWDDDPPEYDPGAEPARIAEEFADAAADLARDEAREARDGGQ